MTKSHHLLISLFVSIAAIGAAPSASAGLGSMITTIKSFKESRRPQADEQASSGAHMPAMSVVSGQQADFRQCPQFFVNGASPIVPRLQQWKPRALCYDAFAILHAGSTKTPLFVAERLSRAHLIDAQDEKRTNKFFADARLPSSERAQPSDYKRSGYDQGHMAPAADMPTAQAMAQSFSLANMVPQAPQNNRKSWRSIESSTRKYVMRAKGDVYVITGPVFDDRSWTIGNGQVRIPAHLFKLVYDKSENRAWAYWHDNVDEARVGRPITYAELVNRTGIEFLPGVRPGSLGD
jgi:endonuclease G